MRLLIGILLASSVFLTPVETWAQDSTQIGSGVQNQFSGQLVPVRCEDPQNCGTCEFAEMINNVIRFLITFASLAATIMIIYGGFRLLTAGGNVSGKEAAKSIIVNVLIGYVLLLAAFLIVNTVLGVLLLGSSPSLGWQNIECLYPTEPEWQQYAEHEVRAPRTATGYNATTMTEEEVSAAVAQATAIAGNRGSGYYAEICNEAVRQGIGEHCNTLIALMIQESGGNPGAVSPANAHGLMQILPGTARGIDPEYFRGMSDAQIAAELKNNPSLSIRLGTSYFKQGLDTSGGDLSNALAYYNGGPRALNQSSTCPGQTWWQCTANSGYAETRNYVANITAMRNQVAEDYSDSGP